MKRKCRRAIIVVQRHSSFGHFPFEKKRPLIPTHHGAGWAVTKQLKSVGSGKHFIPLGLIPRLLGRLFVLCIFHFCVRLVYEPCKSGRNTAWLAARIACSEAKILLNSARYRKGYTWSRFTTSPAIWGGLSC